MYDGPSTLASTGAGVTVLGYSFDLTWILIAGVTFIVAGSVMIIRSRGKKATIL